MAAAQLGPFAGARPPAPAPLLALCLVPSAWYGWLLWAGWPASLFAPTNALVVRDFVNLWAGGRLLLAGDLATLFSPPAYDAWLKGQFGARLDLHTWSYPPPALLLALPFGLLPLLPGFLLWTAATLAALALALRAGGMPAAAILAILASPAAAENALAGQNGALFAALLVGGLASAERRPWLAGLLLGLLVMKPQLGLLVPVALAALGAWRAIGWTAVAAAVLVAGSALFPGLDAWRDYLTQVGPFMRWIAEAPFGAGFHYQMPTPFMTVRAFGGGLGLAYAVQAATSVLAAALVWRSWRPGRATADARIGLLLLLTPLATPYAHSYDLLCAAVGIALLMPPPADGRAAAIRLVLLLAWIWPGIALLFSVGVVRGLGAFILAGAVAAVLPRALRRPSG